MLKENATEALSKDGAFLYYKGELFMDLLKKCAMAFEHLLGYKYHFVIGRKGVSREFDLTFDKADFHHLIGLHKLRDIAQIQQGMRSKIFDDMNLCYI